MIFHMRLIVMLCLCILVSGQSTAEVVSRDPALVWAARCNLIGIAKLLIQKGVDVNERDLLGNTPLHAAVRFPDLLKLLLESGADVNARNVLGETALHLAVRYPRSVALLLEKGAERGLRTFSQRSVLDYCMELGTGKTNLAVAEMLIGK
jgi:ankyrin repeat protein